VSRLWLAAAIAAAVAYGIKHAIPFVTRAHFHPVISAVVILGPYAASYFVATMLLRVPQATTLLRRVGLRR